MDTNFLILMADEHAANIMGGAGHPFIQTPNLDRLAARGTRFTNAYTPNPICVPARACFATGKYGFQTGHWCNATPYTGDPGSWGHALQRNGNPVGSIGKLHYRNGSDDTGFDFQQIPMHLVGGKGDILGCIRDPLPKRYKSRDLAEGAGPGETAYTAYDRQIAAQAVDWISERGGDAPGGKPWTVFVSMVAPHFPLTAPQEFYDMYDALGTMPKKLPRDDDHPALKAQRNCFVYDNFDDEKTRMGLAAYYGLVSFMDANVGRILDALEAAGLNETTRILYTSDHGDNMGERGLWGKSNMYEESAAIPMILAGPGVPEGKTCATAASLVDVFPTLLQTAGIAAADPGLPGRSLVDMANAPDDRDRAVFSEYHAAGALTGTFMVRKGRWKYIHYEGLAPQLFDLEDDPEEGIDLGASDAHAGVRARMHEALLGFCDPAAVHARVLADQSEIVEAAGGAEAVLARGGFGATPAPGVQAEFVKS